ncbi:ATP-binding protein [Streptomyces sp. NPDC059788]|uniref:ATP-binding protein n=1 Tax=Streptomyces sp. NPDC059788 TaxID=3346948 RepID=UPI00366055F7
MRTAAHPDPIHGSCIRLLVQPPSEEGDGISLSQLRAMSRACAEEVCPYAPDYGDAAALVTSELATNALRYGAEDDEPVYVAFPTCPRAFQVRVLDPSPKLPEECVAHDDDEAGRGLFLVHHFTAQYGGRLDVEVTEAGKAVVCTLPSPVLRLAAVEVPA